jgi:methionine synthase I (cobalamin-dependent)
MTLIITVGLPNAMGGYDEKPEQTYENLRDFALSGFLNMYVCWG